MTDRSAIHGAHRRQLLAERTTVRVMFVEPETPWRFDSAVWADITMPVVW
jgi:hypothetical protein